MISDQYHIYVTLEHSHKQHGYICSNNQQCIVWLNSFMPKIIRILKIMFREDI